MRQYPTANANTQIPNLRELKVGHTELLRRCVPYNIRRCEKPATARGLLIRDGRGGIWECKVEHVLIRNARFSLQERGRDVHVRVDCARERENGILRALTNINNSTLVHSKHRRWCTFPAFCSHSCTFPWLSVPSVEAARPGPLRLSACKRTVACSTPDWELRFSSTAGVESGFEGAEPMVVGRQVVPNLTRPAEKPEKHKYKHKLGVGLRVAHCVGSMNACGLDTFRPLETPLYS